jgi:putative membrane protein
VLLTAVPVLAGLAVVAVAYLRGVRTWRARAARAVGPWAPVLAVAGLAVVAAALVPAMDRGAEALFSLHMAQHLALGLVAPLLLVLGRAGDGLAWSVRPATRRELRAMVPGAWHRVRRSPAFPLLAAAATLAAWFAWHAPPLYDLALRQPAVHVVEHLTLFATGWLLWSAAVAQRRQAAPGVLALFLVTLGLGVLGAVLALAPHALYPGHAAGSAAWGVDPLADQQLGALVMWTPGGLVYLVAAMVQLVRWLGFDSASPGLVRTAPHPEPAP